MKVAEGQQVQVADLSARFVETRKRTPTGVHHDSADTVDPDEIPGRSPSHTEGPSRTENLQHDSAVSARHLGGSWCTGQEQCSEEGCDPGGRSDGEVACGVDHSRQGPARVGESARAVSESSHDATGPHLELWQ